MWGSCFAGLGAGAPSRRRVKFSRVRRPEATSSMRADEDADHVAHEGVGGDREVEGLALGASQPASKTSRSKRTWSVWVGVKAVKSWVPGSAAAQASSASRSIRCGHQRARFCSNGLGGRPGVGAGSGRCARGRRRGRRSRPRRLRRRARRRRAGLSAVQPVAPGRRERRPRSTKLATWPSACTPVSVRPATVSSTGSRRIVAEGASPAPPARSAAPAGAPSRENPVPSYSMSRRTLLTGAVCSDGGAGERRSGRRHLESRLHARSAHQRRRDLGARPAGGAPRPARARRGRGRRDRPRLQPQRDRPQHHDPLAAHASRRSSSTTATSATRPTARRSTASASPSSAWSAAAPT